MKKWQLILILILIIPLASCDLVSFNQGGDNQICISNGLDTCNLNYIPTEVTPPSNPPPTSSITYSNLTNLTNVTIPTNETKETNNTIINNINEIGKKLSPWLFLLIGIISILILVSAILFDISRGKLTKDISLFIVTGLIILVAVSGIMILLKNYIIAIITMFISIIFMIIAIGLLIDKNLKK